MTAFGQTHSDKRTHSMVVPWGVLFHGTRFGRKNTHNDVWKCNQIIPPLKQGQTGVAWLEWNVRSSQSGKNEARGRKEDGGFFLVTLAGVRRRRWRRAAVFFFKMDQLKQQHIGCSRAGECHSTWAVNTASSQGGLVLAMRRPILWKLIFHSCRVVVCDVPFERLDLSLTQLMLNFNLTCSLRRSCHRPPPLVCQNPTKHLVFVSFSHVGAFIHSEPEPRVLPVVGWLRSVRKFFDKGWEEMTLACWAWRGLVLHQKQPLATPCRGGLI